MIAPAGTTTSFSVWVTPVDVDGGDTEQSAVVKFHLATVSGALQPPAGGNHSIAFQLPVPVGDIDHRRTTPSWSPRG